VKITNIRATPVNIPLEAPFWWTGGLYPGTSKAIVEVETDEGLVGLGEAPSTDRLLAEYEPPTLDPGVDEQLADFVQRRKAERPDQWH
jgi:L-alanine-DL-glutamate epimerase-like enolase superfamily enzyme